MAGWMVGALALAMALLPRSAAACAACFGRSDSTMAQGMNMGIITLLIVIVSVLLSIALFFVYILRRGSRLAQTANAGAGETSRPDPALSQPISQSTP